MTSTTTETLEPRILLLRWATAFLIAAAQTWVYILLNVWNISRFDSGAWSAISLHTPLDDLIPFVPEAIWTYQLYYPLVLLPVFLIHNQRVLRETAAAYILMLGIGALSWILIPVRMVYPEIGCHSVSCEWLAHLYTIDQGVNVFPSEHTSLSLYVAIRYVESRHPFAIPVAIAAAAVIASTVLIRQHYLLDLPAGALVAWISWRVSRHYFRGK